MTTEYEKAGGIDIHKSFLIVTILGKDGSKLQARFDRNEESLLHLRDWIAENKCPVVACESTNSFWCPIYDTLSPITRVIVGNAHDMKVLSHKKTDKIDSEVIATLALKDMIYPSYIVSQEHRDSRNLMRYRHFLVRKSTDLKNRIHSILDAELFHLSSFVTDIFGRSGKAIIYGIAHKWTFKQIMDAIPSYMHSKIFGKLAPLLNQKVSPVALSQLSGALDLLDSLKSEIRSITALARSGILKNYSKDFEILCSIPGVGEITALTLLAEIGDFRNFASGDKLAAWVGVVPKVHQSANHNARCGITHRGSKDARWIVTQAAHAAVKKKGSIFYKYYESKKDRLGKGKTIIAVARKILTIAWHLIVNNEVFVDEGDKTKKANPKRKVVEISTDISLNEAIKLYLRAKNAVDESVETPQMNKRKGEVFM